MLVFRFAPVYRAKLQFYHLYLFYQRLGLLSNMTPRHTQNI